jgi:YebC/PmpR family DNA-binding regulatory protein
MNARLRLAMDKGITANMSKDTIERAIKKATGELEGVVFEEIRYEGYGPGGVAIMVDCLSDNRTRTVAEVRHAFTRHGGNLGADGSVAFQFQHAGVISFASNRDEARIFEVALEAGADDIDSSNGGVDVVTSPANYEKVRNALAAAGLQFQQAAITMRPQVAVSLGAEDAARCIRLLEALEDLDDVQNVYSNAEFPDDLAA